VCSAEQKLVVTNQLAESQLYAWVIWKMYEKIRSYLTENTRINYEPNLTTVELCYNVMKGTEYFVSL
jgi:hypothetical protein